MNQSRLEQLFPTIFINPKIDVFRFISPSIGYGVFAVAEIEQGELLAEIPFSECIIASNQKLLAEKIARNRQDSKWSEYFSFVLDSGVLNNVPIMWDNVSGISGSLKVLLESIKADFPNVPRWASAYMLSRSFEIEDENDSSIASVPIGDLFNHSTNAYNTRIRQDENGFRFYAESKISAGCEIFNNYGIDDSLTMFATHGFWDTDLITNMVFVPIKFLLETTTEEDEHFLLQIVIDENNIANSCREFLEVYKDQAIEQMLKGLEKMMTEVTDCSPCDNPQLEIINKSQLENLQVLYKNFSFH
jgi:hypothetical protein